MYDEREPEPVSEPDTPNHTKFYWNDLKENYGGVYRLDGSRQFKNHYHRLSRHNQGVNGKWADQARVRRGDNFAILDTVANQLELTTYQHIVARTEFDRVPLSKWSSPNGVDAILVAIMICAVVCAKDLRCERTYNPDRSDETNDPLFLRVLAGLSYQKSTLRSCYQKSRLHLSWEPVDWEAYDDD